jgi:hypothetical protein
MSKTQDPQRCDPERELFGDLYALSQILDTALKNADYVLGERAAASLKYSEYGLEVQSDVKKALPEANPQLIHLAMICEFYWRDFFFDHPSMNITDLVSDISTGVQMKKLVLPYVFGGMLYERASRLFIDMKDVLTPSETTSLLSDTPQGVFQMRSLVSGPLGLLHSLQKRDYRPRRSAPLWHCADPSCSAIHVGRFQETPGPLKLVQQQLRSILRLAGEPIPYQPAFPG